MAKIEEQFNQAIEEWEKHGAQPKVHTSSSSDMFIDCDAYRKIIAMGYEALPLIRELYKKDKDFENDVKYHGLVRAINDIIGYKFQIPEEIRGKVKVIAKYTESWLDKYLKN